MFHNIVGAIEKIRIKMGGDPLTKSDTVAEAIDNLRIDMGGDEEIKSDSIAKALYTLSEVVGPSSGGSYSFHPVAATIINKMPYAVLFSVANMNDANGEIYYGANIGNGPTPTTIYPVIADGRYAIGKVRMEINCDEEYDIILDGSATLRGSRFVDITGDCTITIQLPPNGSEEK